jgi:hypothetical protein
MFGEFVKRPVCVQNGGELPTAVSHRRAETFSSNRSQNLALTPLKRGSKRRSEMFFGFRKSSFGRRRSCGVGHKFEKGGLSKG